MTDPQSAPGPIIDGAAFDQKQRGYAQEIRAANKIVLFDSLAAAGIETVTVIFDDAFAALIDGKTILDLADGLQVRRVRVMGANRIKLTGFTETMRDRLRAYGLFGEIISWKRRFFVPVDATGPAILAKVSECCQIARVADRAVV